MNTRTFLLSVLHAGWFASTALRIAAADDPGTRLTAVLVWGTNVEKPPEKTYRPISPDLEKRLRRVFKWQRYFEIERKEFAVGLAKPAKVDMSKECRLEVAKSERDEFEIQLFGKGVLVVTKRQRIAPGETVVLGGDDKDDDAWFVVLTLAKPRSPEG